MDIDDKVQYKSMREYYVYNKNESQRIEIILFRKSVLHKMTIIINKITF
jgi:hypothetical protein